MNVPNIIILNKLHTHGSVLHTFSNAVILLCTGYFLLMVAGAEVNLKLDDVDHYRCCLEMEKKAHKFKTGFEFSLHSSPVRG